MNTKKLPIINKLIFWFIVFALNMTTYAFAMNNQAIIVHPEPAINKSGELTLHWWIEGLNKTRIKDLKKDENIQLLLGRSSNGSADTTYESVNFTKINMSDKVACYLILVDDSKSMKKAYNGKNNKVKNLLETLFDGKGDNYVGLASFSDKWNDSSPDKQELIIKPTTSNIDKSKLDLIRPRGAQTELLRYTKQGIQELSKTCNEEKIARKVLVIISDGAAEDPAFSSELVLKEARKNNISIYTFGFDGGKEIELQLLVLLAEESGGWYSAPEAHEKDLSGEVQALYDDSSEWGGLRSTLPIRAGQKLQLKIAPNDSELTDDSVPTIDLPEPLEIAEIPFYRKRLLKWFHWLNNNQLTGLLIFLILLTAIGLLWLLYRYLFKNKKDEAANAPIGVLVNNGKPHPLFPGINAIGFLPESDIKIDHPTVGRTHATIHYQGDGAVILTDLGSQNGSWFNGQRISGPTAISHNDMIRFGEWEAIFQLIGVDDNNG